MGIRIKDGEFVDEHDRILNLRGVNLSGSSKIPSNKSNINWLDTRSVTFVNRPFPLSDAPLHFARLRACGFTFLRFIVTWEAIEHEGPGIYDVDYLAYIRQILEVASEHGMQIYIDPHQDVWSRWTGGDGAPLWTLQLAGFDVDNLRECEAAISPETYGRGHSSAEKQIFSGNQKNFPKMIWPTNYFKLACATMYTLFWAGERFAPNFMVDDVDDDDGNQGKINIQRYLQKHYTKAMAQLIKHLVGLDNIVGVGTMNEPSPGYINVADLSLGFGQSPSEGSSKKPTLDELKYGLAPTPFQGMCLGEGHKQSVGEWSNGFLQHILGKPDRWVTVNPGDRKAWTDSSAGCIWKQAGVWCTNPQTSQPELLRPDYFANVDFGRECYLPFASKYAEVLSSIWTSEAQQPLLIFVELPPLEFTSTPFPEIKRDDLPNAVNATHWYDGVTLFTRSWKSYFSVNTRSHYPVFGYNNIFKMHTRELADIKRLGTDNMHGAPTLIGECGIPYDMVGTNFSSFGPQLAAMNHTLKCLEENMLSFTLWCYTPDNTNREGDWWNGEDLSLFCNDQKKKRNGPNKEKDVDDIYDGLRASRAFARPYARCIAGKPTENKFDLQKGLFRCVYRTAQKYDVPTEIFVPKLWCPSKSDMNIRMSKGGRWEVEEGAQWFVVKCWNADSGDAVENKVEIGGPGMKMQQLKMPFDIFG
eukprot:CAMPEP_0183710176 /NCGR_PEP_ID=MMETSP0737-20130205/5985_1 /TAXON_ID=385413 /ORGANISM="Thalassiosira miniscula, Strain CCMP1093" /LENGTH=697 /DNA_ID=CAMNT_0025938399 /DNA_START=76 /DNA_END=2169 /DNA_ORIENTATION=+